MVFISNSTLIQLETIILWNCDRCIVPITS